MTSSNATDTFGFSFPDPVDRLNMNSRMHWAKRAGIAREWRRAAFIHARNTHRQDLPPSIITVRFTVATHRNRDPHNWAPTVKPIVDGMVDAKFWPDDNADWVAVTDPVFDVDRSNPNMTTVQIRPMGES